MGKQKVQLSRRNWDVDYVYDIMTGNGFTITEKPEFELNGKKEKSYYGTRSPLYGTDFSDEQAFMERYRCNCGAFTGTQFEGETCPICNTKIEFKDINVNFTGWISLHEYHIINPYYFKLIGSAIGVKTLNEIAYIKKRVDSDGKIRELDLNIKDAKLTHPFVGIGIEEFRNKYEEVLEFFYAKRKKKREKITTLIKEKSKAFTSHIPVYSTVLRPQSYTTDTYYYNTIDKKINPIVSKVQRLENAKDIELMVILSSIQKNVNDLWNLNFEQISGKDAWIRGQVLGGSLQYTSRNVIIPDPTLKINEVSLSYNTFRELYKQKIIYYLMKLDNCTLSKAYDQWSRSYKYDKKVYEIMQYIVEREQPKLLINRNPTLNYYSMLLMKIRDIKSNVNDYTMSIPLAILPGLNADFDGDILNIIALASKEIEKAMSKFDPTTKMIISRDTGELNPYFEITKNQRIDLHYFATV